MNSAVADLMRLNLLDVFNEPDPERRNAAIAQTYTQDTVWHEPDRIIRGREALAQRTTELRAQTPDSVYRPTAPSPSTTTSATSASSTAPPVNHPSRPEWTSPAARTASS